MKLNISANEANMLAKDVLEKEAAEKARQREAEMNKLRDLVKSSFNSALKYFDLKKEVEKEINTPRYYSDRKVSIRLLERGRNKWNNEPEVLQSHFEELEEYESFICELEKLGFFPEFRVDVTWDYGSGSDCIPEVSSTRFYIDIYLTKSKEGK